MSEDLLSVKNYLLGLQENICTAFEQVDSKACFSTEPWTHIHGGGGITRTLSDGAIFEKAGVNFSSIQGDRLPAAAKEQHPSLEKTELPFTAMGISIVAHPFNPYVPTTHCNLRFFKTLSEPSAWWFGGGYDLTPYYPFQEDVVAWHRSAQSACKPFGDTVYPRYKQWCDEYFFLKHRNETRGVGGLFFDDLHAWGFARSFEFIQCIGNQFLSTYLDIVKKRHTQDYGERERWFQQYRRGRYVEFNLLYDRGTLFGLQSQGRVESILMSLPPRVIWHYNWKPEPNSPEADLYENYLQPRDWL